MISGLGGGLLLGLLSGLISGLGGGLLLGLLSGLIIGLVGGLASGLQVGLLSGLIIVLGIGLIYGGRACLQHLVLRLWLWYHGTAPWHYVDFLDYAAERIFLRKVGGGYMFIHRLLQDYFASLHTGAGAAADRSASTTASSSA